MTPSIFDTMRSERNLWKLVPLRLVHQWQLLHHHAKEVCELLPEGVLDEGRPGVSMYLAGRARRGRRSPVPRFCPPAFASAIVSLVRDNGAYGIAVWALPARNVA